MKIKDGMQDEYAAYVEMNSKDGYSRGVVDYGERWADLMEAGMEKELESGGSLGNLADRTSNEADTDGITGFMYGCAVQALAQFWEHGDALRRWNNLKLQIGNEGERANETGGVLNPALLSIG